MVLLLFLIKGKNTPARMLLEKGTFKLNGKIKKCLAEVKQFEFSGHNSRDELFEILDNIKGKPKVLTVHGDGNSCIKFAEEITEKYGFDVIAPDSGDIFKI